MIDAQEALADRLVTRCPAISIERGDRQMAEKASNAANSHGIAEEAYCPVMELSLSDSIEAGIRAFRDVIKTVNQKRE